MAVHICLATILKYKKWKIESFGGFCTEQSFMSKMSIDVFQKGKESEQKVILNFQHFKVPKYIQVPNYQFLKVT